MHGDVVRDGLVVTFVGEENTDLRGQVLVRAVEVGLHLLAFETTDAAQVDLLAQGGTGLGDELGDGLAVGLDREQRLG